MVRITNLSEAKNQRIRLTPAAGATSDISASTGAIAKDGEDILICLAPAKPYIPTDPLALRIIPVSQDFGISRYYAKGIVRPELEESIFHDLPQAFNWDMIAFGDPEADPITLMPKPTHEDLVYSSPWPNIYGHVARDMREIESTPSHMVIFPNGFVQAVREQVLPTDPTRVVLTEDWVYESNPDDNYTENVTAADFIDYLDNGIYGFWFNERDYLGKLTLTLDTGLGEPPVVYRVNPVLEKPRRWTSNLLTQSQGYVIPGLFTGLTGFGFVEYGGNNEETNGGGGSQYKAVRADGSGETIGFNGGSNQGMDAFVQPNGDAVLRMKEIGDWYVQFSLLTETDMDLSDRGQGVLNLECHYMKTAVPEHKLFHHRFFFSLYNEYNPV